jgi:OPA family glycerol-3-phosphate transporter-like MFS transporter
LIFAAGAVTYAFLFLVNGPGGQNRGEQGDSHYGDASAANIALGVITWLVLTDRLHVRLLGIFSIAYALNMYFQSYGAVSIIKVKAH